MGDVTVIGLGVMGSALARALLQGEHHVTVWNRTSSKAEALARDGASLAPDPASAIDASPVVIICVADYGATRAILSAPHVGAHVANRVLVQLSTGTPQDARDMERWAQDSQAGYLDGVIEVGPNLIGTPEASISVAGSETAFRRCEPLLRILAGRLSYLGEQVGAAKALSLALSPVVFGTLLGTLHYALIWEVEGLPVEEMVSRLATFMPTVGEAMKDWCERIKEGRYDESPGTVQTGAYSADLVEQHARESRIDLAFPTCVSEVFQKGMHAGLGNEDVAALIEILRARA